MVAKRRKMVISLLTGVSVFASMTSYCGCKILKNGYIGTFYGIDKETIINDSNIKSNDCNLLGDNDFLFEKYPSFSNVIESSSVKAIIHDDMVPQGLTIMGDYILTTSYDYSGLSNSMVYVLDKNGNTVNACTLDTDSHVGGIAYDRKNDLVWIPSHNGKLNAYKASDFLTSDEIKAYYSNLDVGDGLRNYKNPLKNSIAFLTIDEDDLFVGSFSVASSGLVKRYSISIDDDMIVHLNLKGLFYIPTKVQGMTFYKSGDKKYIIFSRSFGKNNSSLLQIFVYDENIIYYNSSLESVAYTAPSMMEQVSLDEDYLYVIFESAAKAYSGCDDEFDAICSLDAEAVVSPLLKKRY